MEKLGGSAMPAAGCKAVASACVGTKVTTDGVAITLAKFNPGWIVSDGHV
jgi:hypothetical protein